MPRKAFIADLSQAVTGISIAGLSNVKRGDDGEFTFDVLASGKQLQISALVPEVSEYPSDHTYMLFAPDDAPANVAAALSGISNSAAGKPILRLLDLVSRTLGPTDLDGDSRMPDSQQRLDDNEGEDQDGEEEEEEDYDDDDDEPDEEYFPDEDMAPKPLVAVQGSAAWGGGYTPSTSAFRDRIRADLLTAKAAGFKVGHLGGLMDGLGCYVILSCRIAKLGISKEAMQAWQVGPSEYLVMVISYPNGYKSMDSICAYDTATTRRNLIVRVGISKNYKPTMTEAYRAFTVYGKDQKQYRDTEDIETLEESRNFRNSFISRPLNELMEQRFPILLKYRYSGMPWEGAEAFYNHNCGASATQSQEGFKEEYFAPESASAALPSLVTADHIQDATGVQHSLPLVTMQFVLRHFVRCTEFCLVCFSRMPDDLQAIKPYVCDDPLCLYQYMSLGFGPSIEHEIMSQPRVVDLLISFCYASARSAGLKTFPSGLSLMVPPKEAYGNEYANLQAQNYSSHCYQLPRPSSAAGSSLTTTATNMRYNLATHEILFDVREDVCPFRPGDWLVVRVDTEKGKPLHCRVVETTFYPTVKVSQPITRRLPSSSVDTRTVSSSITKRSSGIDSPKAEPPKDVFVPATFHQYNQNFDELGDLDKRETIYGLLDLLPSVNEMKQYLDRGQEMSLRSWTDTISPAGVGLLRWIIASNRACIVQVGGDDDEHNRGSKTEGEERLWGMSGWSQFRFAMGAPDKELKFVQAVHQTTDRLQLKYPTIYAWHGSPLWNWHSIIREGLHFNNVAHGRAYGNGVYHSLDATTSLGYSGSAATWPSSDLNIIQAMALNEVVNAPQDFVSKSPHLVVHQLDWIQTRYLFVKTAATGTTNYTAVTPEPKPLDVVDQDPSMTPKGPNGQKLIIPAHAISAREAKSLPVKASKRRKTGNKEDDDDAASVSTTDEDRAILQEEVSSMEVDSLSWPNSTSGESKSGGLLDKLKHSKTLSSSTDFVPGTLDFSILPMLQQPTWALPAATKRLMNDFRDLLKVQEREPLHELGWYIDPERIENVYQWIVELHSFDQTLPLAKDMKAQNVQSIVLELRFGNHYPMTPPFVRVIEPRFLPFASGGGGHITAGGAMCMQLLTNDGWLPSSSIESVLLQVRMAIASLDPKPARLEGSGQFRLSQYGVGEAIEAYIRACTMHGWTVPEGFREMAMGGVPV